MGHLRTTNPIESAFATVRHRTVRTRGALSQKTAKLTVFSLIQAASKKRLRLRGKNQLPRVIEGTTCNDGIDQTVVSGAHIEDVYADGLRTVTSDPPIAADCISVCVFAFAGGLSRFASKTTPGAAVGFQDIGRLGIHQFHLDKLPFQIAHVRPCQFPTSACYLAEVTHKPMRMNRNQGVRYLIWGISGSFDEIPAFLRIEKFADGASSWNRALKVLPWIHGKRASSFENAISMALTLGG